MNDEKEAFLTRVYVLIILFIMFILIGSILWIQSTILINDPISLALAILSFILSISLGVLLVYYVFRIIHIIKKPIIKRKRIVKVKRKRKPIIKEKGEKRSKRKKVVKEKEQQLCPFCSESLVDINTPYCGKCGSPLE